MPYIGPIFNMKFEREYCIWSIYIVIMILNFRINRKMHLFFKSAIYIYSTYIYSRLGRISQFYYNNDFSGQDARLNYTAIRNIRNVYEYLGMYSGMVWSIWNPALQQGKRFTVHNGIQKSTGGSDTGFGNLINNCYVHSFTFSWSIIVLLWFWETTYQLEMILLPRRITKWLYVGIVTFCAWSLKVNTTLLDLVFAVFFNSIEDALMVIVLLLTFVAQWILWKWLSNFANLVPLAKAMFNSQIRSQLKGEQLWKSHQIDFTGQYIYTLQKSAFF